MIFCGTHQMETCLPEMLTQLRTSEPSLVQQICKQILSEGQREHRRQYRRSRHAKDSDYRARILKASREHNKERYMKDQLYRNDLLRKRREQYAQRNHIPNGSDIMSTGDGALTPR